MSAMTQEAPNDQNMEQRNVTQLSPNQDVDGSYKETQEIVNVDAGNRSTHSPDKALCVTQAQSSIRDSPYASIFDPHQVHPVTIQFRVEQLDKIAKKFRVGPMSVATPTPPQQAARV